MVVRENRWHFAMPPMISPRNDVWETSAEIPYWWRVTTQIRVLLLIGCATCEICFNQSRALPHWVVTHHQYGISALVSQTSFHRETVGGIVKCHLFSQATVMAENLVILLWPISVGETNPWQGVCYQSINQSINQSFILTRYIKELKNSFNWNNWGQRDPCYSIICKLKRSEYDYTQAPVFEAAWVDSMNLVKLSVFLSCVVSYVYLLCSILFSVWLQLHRFVLNVKVSQYHTCTFLMKSCCRYFPFCHTKTWHLALEFAVSSIVYPWMKPCVSFCYKSFINLASVVQKLDRAIHWIERFSLDCRKTKTKVNTLANQRA